MKKKLFLLLALVLCLTPVLGLVGCGDDYAELEYNVRYIYDNQYIRSENNYEKTYFVFYKNGTGKYHYYYYSYGYTQVEYTIGFKYTYVDEDKSTVMCYYDSIKFEEKHVGTNKASDYDDWSNMVTVSKNALMRTTGTGIGFFINENYLSKEIVNYRNEKESTKD